MRIYRPKITKEYIIWIDLNFFHRWTFEVFTNFEDLAVLFFTFMIIFFPKSTFISTSPPPHVLSESSVGEIWFMIWRLLSLYRFRFRMSFICIYIRFRDLKKSSWSWIWYHSLSFLTVHVGGGTYYHIFVQGLLSRVLFSSHILLVSALIITTKGGKYIITGIIVCQYCQLAEFSAD